VTEFGQSLDQAESQDRLEPHDSGDGEGRQQPFLALAQDLAGEHGRLLELAETCRTYAERLALREAELAERERWVSEAQESFTRQVRELSQREQEVNEQAARAEEADRRLGEAEEREAALGALGAKLVERFGAR
jgi:hypothetical protein